MKNSYKIFLILFLLITLPNFASGGKVLVEIFTNSHCPLCPPSHSTIDNYLQSSNGDKIEFIYYHMVFPYSTDQLYQFNTSDAEAKNNLYGPYSSTPQAFFNGVHIGNSYNSWASNLDGLVAEESYFNIDLSGSYSDANFTINADITKTLETTENDLTINFVVVENVQYQGNNGISNHKNVMRKIANINGDSFNLNVNSTITKSATFTFNENWNPANLKIIAYVQSLSTKKVYQAESVLYSSLSLTDVNENNDLLQYFSLSQNYPNPFNPSTTIIYTIANSVISNPYGVEKSQNSNNLEISNNQSADGQDGNYNVSLKIYDVLGREVTTLVNQSQRPGKYTVQFDGSNFVSGIYFYRLKTNNYTETKSMILAK